VDRRFLRVEACRPHTERPGGQFDELGGHAFRV
jgi:hypothetical protein